MLIEETLIQTNYRAEAKNNSFLKKDFWLVKKVTVFGTANHSALFQHAIATLL